MSEWNETGVASSSLTTANLTDAVAVNGTAGAVVTDGGNATGPPPPDMTAFYVWDILFAAIILVAVIGNLIVIWIVFGEQTM